jgi:AraC-like DNA-binding protein
MEIQVYTPRGPLKDFVLSIHYLSGSGIGTGVALQRLHQVIIINLGTDFSATDIHTGAPRQDAHTGSVWINGKQETPFMLQNNGTTAMYAVTLREGMLPFFAGLPASETNDLAVGVEHWRPTRIQDLHGRLMETDNIQRGFHYIEDYFSAHLRGADLHNLTRIRWIGQALYTASVAEIGGALGVSRKRLREEALHSFGGSVKQLQGIIRFNQTLASIAAGSGRPLSRLHAYYDQSHFISDFKHRAQMTPLQYRRLCGRFPQIRHTPNFMAMTRETFLQFLAE